MKVIEKIKESTAEFTSNLIFVFYCKGYQKAIEDVKRIHPNIDLPVMSKRAKQYYQQKFIKFINSPWKGK